MADRPPFLCELDKGKLIDTQVGFVDTFNYAVAAIDNLKGGKNCTVDWTIPDQPVINVEIDDDGESGGGTPDVSAVYDVTAATSESKSGILIDYLDARVDKFIAFPQASEVSAVYDVVAATSGSQSGISIQYVDARADTFIPFTGGGGNVSFTGTNGTTGNSSNAFTFSSARDANVVVKCYGTGIEIGVYYV